jgi:hypothetical protein
VKIKVLPSALTDLDRGRQFYEQQEEVLGDYFLDSLFSDIDSLVLYAGVHLLLLVRALLRVGINPVRHQLPRTIPLLARSLQRHTTGGMLGR